VFFLPVASIFLFFTLSINPAIEKMSGRHFFSPASWSYQKDLVRISIAKNQLMLPRKLIKEEFQHKKDLEILSVLATKEGTDKKRSEIWDVVKHDRSNEFQAYAYQVILSNPGPVILSRLESVKIWFNIGRTAFSLRLTDENADRLGISRENPNPVRTFMIYCSERLQSTFLFKGKLYVGIISFLTIWAFSALLIVRSKNEMQLFGMTVLTAGSLNWLTLVPLLTGPEFRYLAPTIMCLMSGSIMMIVSPRTINTTN
jgi:hypothetical protein